VFFLRLLLRCLLAVYVGWLLFVGFGLLLFVRLFAYVIVLRCLFSFVCIHYLLCCWVLGDSVGCLVVYVVLVLLIVCYLLFGLFGFLAETCCFGIVGWFDVVW